MSSTNWWPAHGRKLERLLLALGVALIAIYGLTRLYTGVASRVALGRFHNREAVRDKSANAAAPEGTEPGKTDFSLWSTERIRAYKDALTLDFDPPIAVLSLPRQQLQVPVFRGTDELVLSRGAGLIDGTALPDGEGNVGIAAHRDGFFRVLKDVHVGDPIEIKTPRRTRMYTVDEIRIVYPEDVSVLRSGLRPSVTLVTCYPFFYVGSAPQRYIVRASHVQRAQR